MNKCKGCNHSISSHYCIVTDDRKEQYCKTCGVGHGDPSKCYAVVRNHIGKEGNIDIHIPILNFWHWKYYNAYLRPKHPKLPPPPEIKRFFGK